MVRVSEDSLPQYGGALTIGVVAGVSRLIQGVPPMAGYAGILGGVVVGLGVGRYEKVSQKAVGAGLLGTAIYAVLLGVGALTKVYSMPGAKQAKGINAVGPLLEPVLFLPLLVVEALVVAAVVKRLRAHSRDDQFDFS